MKGFCEKYKRLPHVLSIRVTHHHIVFTKPWTLREVHLTAQRDVRSTPWENILAVVYIT